MAVKGVILALMVGLIFGLSCIHINNLYPDLNQERSGERVIESKENLAHAIKRMVQNKEKGPCEDLFSSAEFKHFNFTKEYVKGLPELKRKIQIIPNATPEGSSGDLREQSLMLHFLAQGPHVRTVCETGFNVGYSAFAYLSANPNITVHSFDIGRRTGTKPMSEYLKSIYGDRISVHFGDSTVTLLAVHKQNHELKCDVILVDGGHLGKVPWTDIQNFVSMFAVPGQSVMMYDDFPNAWNKVIHTAQSVAWRMAVHYRLVKEIMRCTWRARIGRGFTMGLVTSSKVINNTWWTEFQYPNHLKK